ncbi:MAG: heme-binding domain-containing protein [Muricauda sp.]|nr:heme-binding domain-containing protein [Allomuricauda sp.]MBO6531743.1 heme-binding domain-containing protein [Allomuricauda sp.]MBO6589029.1 heme-binding domain-containing protein [Allomuricauda sp.]MBO6618654.1 heme-binding domain-containing protein [Allomuricauda sp.]MBO6644567.1 heme-binding domain-containing protein [Allomuricauda sp.]MBO6746467.1 heme-binding domain-containing protein [Allomuricauda sp.]
MKIAKKIALALLVVLVGMQFYRPEKNVAAGDYVAAFETETNPSPEVKAILNTACYDCHSDNTEYPWYNNIAPVSYWLADHIEDGKKHLNFSDWQNYDAKKKDHKLEELIEEVKEGEMPLKEYTWTHGDAKLTQEQISALVAWADGVRANY